MGALEVDGCIDAAGVEIEPVKLVGGESGCGAVCGSTQTEGALGAVVGYERGSEKFGESAGAVAAQGLHLPESVLGSDEALGEDEVVERGSLDVGDAVIVATDGYGLGETGDGESAIDLGEGIAHGVAGPDARAEEDDDKENKYGNEEDGEVAREA
jgi:hypothetical protein